MTRKDYVMLAEALRGARPRTGSDRGNDWREGWAVAAHAIADALAHDNPRFDRARFLRAAGVNQE